MIDNTTLSNLRDIVLQPGEVGSIRVNFIKPQFRRKDRRGENAPIAVDFSQARISLFSIPVRSIARDRQLPYRPQGVPLVIVGNPPEKSFHSANLANSWDR